MHSPVRQDADGPLHAPEAGCIALANLDVMSRKASARLHGER
jgi:hypothetical protein